MERLADPQKDRVVSSVPLPPAKPLANSLLFPEGSKIPEWKCLCSHLAAEGRLTKEATLNLCWRATEITKKEPNLLKLKDPLTVVGDIHGQFYDLIKLLDVGGKPETTQYLFLGDYVDRGSFSVECLLLLLALKINYPERIWILRGNHECRQMTSFFNFRDECEYKLDLTVYHAFMDLFDTLPFAAVINGKFFAVHGGLSPELKLLAQIGRVNRFEETPRYGMLCDILWADPVDEDKSEHLAKKEPFFPNDVRGCSYFFSPTAATTFLEKNGLISVIRAHEAQLEGYKMHKVNKKTGFPTIITIFSAPNYCDCYNNKGAVLRFENNTLNIQQFNLSPHPYHLPNFMDVFTWSIPFVSEKVTEMLYALIKPSLDGIENDESVALDSEDVVLPPEVSQMISKSAHEPPKESEDGSSTTRGEMTMERRETLRRKVQSVSRLMRMFRTLREHNETIVLIKNCNPGHRIPMGALLDGGHALKNELQRFLDIKVADEINEKRPEC